MTGVWEVGFKETGIKDWNGVRHVLADTIDEAISRVRELVKSEYGDVSFEISLARLVFTIDNMEACH